ncbi:hypothetical protein [Actinomycetospora aeridis]|uniref:Uncharacterized protein n=1 Tax=Actinomycetospora aeridis TaxID=3129231 RepID=A0ABU8N942_9PSEU
MSILSNGKLDQRSIPAPRAGEAPAWHELHALLARLATGFEATDRDARSLAVLRERGLVDGQGGITTLGVHVLEEE